MESPNELNLKVGVSAFLLGSILYTLLVFSAGIVAGTFLKSGSLYIEHYHAEDYDDNFKNIVNQKMPIKKIGKK